jgi:hypothetical protein
MRTDFSSPKDAYVATRRNAFAKQADNDLSSGGFKEGGAAGADRCAVIESIQAVTFAPEEDLERWDGMG